MQNKLGQKTSSDADTVPSEALRVFAETGLAQRVTPAGEAEVQRMVRTLLRLQPAALSAIAATAALSSAAQHSPADMAQNFALNLKPLAV
jgi:predicted unusual protein kinase regulating ubiquinone biosynthesis (AarF/ABC1/UbiB family)